MLGRPSVGPQLSSTMEEARTEEEPSPSRVVPVGSPAWADWILAFIEASLFLVCLVVVSRYALFLMTKKSTHIYL